jgi:ribose 5-phosphate isomerase B
MKIVVGSDHLGFPLKEDVKAYLQTLGHDPVDLGCQNPHEPVDYPDVAVAVAEEIAGNL